jgi:hypothetical protein
MTHISTQLSHAVSIAKVEDAVRQARKAQRAKRLRRRATAAA